MHKRLCWALVFLTLPAVAAERAFDFADVPAGQAPPGFRSAVMGKGKPGTWQVVLDAVPPLLAPLAPATPDVSRRPVLAQLAQDPTDEHFPMLIYEGDTFGDFKLTTRFKTVKGVMEQMAGIAFRVQNETNYYVVRASSLGNTFKFYKVQNGERGPLVGPEVPVTPNVWHELEVRCQGNAIHCLLDGKELITVADKANALTSGKIAFWTKSDSVSYFAETKIEYTPFEPPAQKLVRDMLRKYPRLVGMNIYVAGKTAGTSRLVASGDEKELNQPGGKTEHAVISTAQTYYGKEPDSVSVVMPLRDRNGDPIAAVRVVMKSFRGQTEENAILRATPLVKELQAQVQSLEDLSE
jgi:hypothetical protein